MANPPITIGELSNVPAPLSPVASAWCQDATERIVHHFASVADRAARWPTPLLGSLSSRADGNGRTEFFDGVGWLSVGDNAFAPTYTAPAGSGAAGALRPGESGRAARFTIPADVPVRFDYAVLLGAGGPFDARLILHDATGSGATFWTTFVTATGGGYRTTAIIPGIRVAGLGNGHLVDVTVANEATSTGELSWFLDGSNNVGRAYWPAQ
jgi:hypothetical protein